MFKILIISLIGAVGVRGLFAPIVAIAGYYLVSLLQPQGLWSWYFNGIPVFKILAGICIISVLLNAKKLLRQGDQLKQVPALLIIILSIAIYLSHIFSSFPEGGRFVAITISTFTVILTMYFISMIGIRSEKDLILLSNIFIGVVIYYTWWANSAYFGQEWYRFSGGRLNGPPSTPYSDGNILSVLIVMGYPFIFLSIFKAKSKLKKGLWILLIPFLWHAILLLGSRGALLSLGIVTLLISVVMKLKVLRGGIVLALVFFVIAEGAVVINRTEEVSESVEAGEVANPRLISWKIGWNLFLNDPVLGVGIGVERFLAASNYYYPGQSPHVAHNTLIALLAGSGVFAGGAFIGLLVFCYRSYKMNKRYDHLLSKNLVYLNQAIYFSLVGFFICSIFLDLVIFEPFYFIVLLLSAKHYLISNYIESERVNK